MGILTTFLTEQGVGAGGRAPTGESDLAAVPLIQGQINLGGNSFTGLTGEVLRILRPLDAVVGHRSTTQLSHSVWNVPSLSTLW